MVKVAWLALVFLFGLFATAISAEPLHVTIARKYVGVVEKGNNAGEPVETFLRSVGLGKGNPWCAAFVYFCLREAGATFPAVRSGLARSYRVKESHTAAEILKGTYEVQVGDLLIWGYDRGYSGHIGIVIAVLGPNRFRMIEGNTSCTAAGDQRNGGMCCIKVRSIEPRARMRIMWATEVSYKSSRESDRSSDRSRKG